MNKKEKQTQIALGTYLQLKWGEYLKIFEESSKLFIRAAEQYPESPILYAKAENMRISATLLFETAVKEVYGKNMQVIWRLRSNSCVLGNGIIFK